MEVLGAAEDDFWASLQSVIKVFAARNKELRAKLDQLQLRIDGWYRARKGTARDLDPRAASNLGGGAKAGTADARPSGARVMSNSRNADTPRAALVCKGRRCGGVLKPRLLKSRSPALSPLNLPGLLSELTLGANSLSSKVFRPPVGGVDAKHILGLLHAI